MPSTAAEGEMNIADAGLWFVIVLLYFAVFGAFCGWLADEKGRSPGLWFILGMFFSLPALLALAGAPSRLTVGAGAGEGSDGSPHLGRAPWSCPQCTGENPATVFKCGYCDYKLV